MTPACRRAAALAIAALIASPPGEPQAVRLEPVSAGAWVRIGAPKPERLALDLARPATLTKLPDAVSATPLHGILPIGPRGTPLSGPTRTFHVVIDEAPDRPAALYVDTNGNGDLTDDPPAQWRPRPYRSAGADFTEHRGWADVEVLYPDGPRTLRLILSRFDPTDPSKSDLITTLFYAADYSAEGQIALRGTTFPILLADIFARGDFRGIPEGNPLNLGTGSGIRLLIDANRNGSFDLRGEDFDVRKPFCIRGVTYEIARIAPSGLSLELVVSDKTVPEIPTPPDHRAGLPITPFEATTTEGAPVNFPNDHAGRIVLLDFWAMWSKPCASEEAAIAIVYRRLHDRGFDVLGINLDEGDALHPLREFAAARSMTWPQVCDGKGLSGAIADRYMIQSVPTAFLVDGDTGEILATGAALRAEQLEATVADALARKRFGG